MAMVYEWVVLQQLVLVTQIHKDCHNIHIHSTKQAKQLQVCVNVYVGGQKEILYDGYFPKLKKI